MTTAPLYLTAARLKLLVWRLRLSLAAQRLVKRAIKWLEAD